MGLGDLIPKGCRPMRCQARGLGTQETSSTDDPVWRGVSLKVDL
jgi:hypothetical protein